MCILRCCITCDMSQEQWMEPRITGKFPGYLSPSAGLKFADVPNGLAAISKVPAAGWGQILAYMAFCEVSQDQLPGTPAAAGDFGFKVLTSSDPAQKTKKLSAELANGRLAMMAIIGMFFQASRVCHVYGRGRQVERCIRMLIYQVLWRCFWVSLILIIPPLFFFFFLSPPPRYQITFCTNRCASKHCDNKRTRNQLDKTRAMYVTCICVRTVQARVSRCLHPCVERTGWEACSS